MQISFSYEFSKHQNIANFLFGADENYHFLMDSEHFLDTASSEALELTF
jgi:hypothetical protein